MPKDATKRKTTRARKPTHTLRERRVIYTAEQIFVGIMTNAQIESGAVDAAEQSLVAAEVFWSKAMSK